MKRAQLSTTEIAWIRRHPLARLATVDHHGAPQNNPVSAYYNPTTNTIDIGGHNMATSRKFRNAALTDAHAALVIDDIHDNDPSTIRLLEIRGPITAITNPTDSAAHVPGPILRIRPHTIISWGLDH